jgi:hypothetical protein
MNADGLVESPPTVMPDLIPARPGIFDRHPEHIDFTGFRLEFIRLWWAGMTEKRKI